MEANSHLLSVQECEHQNQQHEGIIRQEYEVRLAGGHKSVIPSACRGLELPLAHTHKPDYSMALDMPAGVSEAFHRDRPQVHVRNFHLFNCPRLGTRPYSSYC
jgi:hypothetical protein